MLVTLLTLAAACGGKIAPEGQGGGGSSGTDGTRGTGNVDEPPQGSLTAPAPTPTSSPSPPPAPANRPGAECPASPPGEGSDCGWQYGIPCDYSVPRRGDTCAVQCICVGNDRNTNRWTCFDIGCDDG